MAANAADSFFAEKPWQDQFDRLCKTLESLALSVLVVVDDIDGLHTDELLSVFRSIRLLGRFPGVEYLLAYDEDSVRTTLQGMDLMGGSEDRALRYLEKRESVESRDAAVHILLRLLELTT